jgi:hypothetical protein
MHAFHVWRLLYFEIWRRVVWYQATNISEELLYTAGGGSRFLRNVGNDISGCTTSHLRRQQVNLHKLESCRNLWRNTVYWAVENLICFSKILLRKNAPCLQKKRWSTAWKFNINILSRDYQWTGRVSNPEHSEHKSEALMPERVSWTEREWGGWCGYTMTRKKTRSSKLGRWWGAGYIVFVIDYVQHLEVTEPPMHWFSSWRYFCHVARKTTEYNMYR